MEESKTESPAAVTRSAFDAIKRRHPGTLLLMREGDEYKAFDDDADTAAGILGKRVCKGRWDDGTLRMVCRMHRDELGVNLPRLIRNGQRVAVCNKTGI